MPPVAMVTTSPCEVIGGPVNVLKDYRTHTGERSFSLKRLDCA